MHVGDRCCWCGTGGSAVRTMGVPPAWCGALLSVFSKFVTEFVEYLLGFGRQWNMGRLEEAVHVAPASDMVFSTNRELSKLGACTVVSPHFCEDLLGFGEMVVLEGLVDVAIVDSVTHVSVARPISFRIMFTSTGTGPLVAIVLVCFVVSSLRGVLGDDHRRHGNEDGGLHAAADILG